MPLLLRLFQLDSFLDNGPFDRLELALVQRRGVDDNEPVGASFQGLLQGLGMVDGAFFALGDAADRFPSVDGPGTFLELVGQVIGLRQPGNEAHFVLGHLVQVGGRDEGRIGHIDHFLGVKKALPNLVDDLAVPHLVAGVAVLDRAKQREPFARDDQAADELFEVGTAIFAVAVADVQHRAVGALFDKSPVGARQFVLPRHGDGCGIGMDGANAQRQQACGSLGDRVNEAPQIAGCMESIQGAAEGVVVEVVQRDRLIEENGQIKALKRLPNAIQRPALGEDVDHQSDAEGAGRRFPLGFVPGNHPVHHPCDFEPAAHLGDIAADADVKGGDLGHLHRFAILSELGSEQGSRLGINFLLLGLNRSSRAHNLEKDVNRALLGMCLSG